MSRSLGCYGRLWVVSALIAGVVGCGSDGPADVDGDAGQHVTAALDVATGDAVGAAPAVELVDLGEVQTGGDGVSVPLSFDLPADVTAIVVVLDGPPDVWLQLAELSPPGAVALVPPAWLGVVASPVVCLAPCANRVLAQPDVAAFLFPNTPLVTLHPGKTRLRVHTFVKPADDADTQPVAAKVHVKMWWVREVGGGRDALPLNLMLTGAGGLDAAHALEVPAFATAVERMKALLAAAGVKVAPVRLFDVAAEGRYVVTRDGDDSDLAALFRSGAAAPAGVNVFVTERIWASAGGPGSDALLGLSGGIPIAPLEVGSSRAGVAISWQLGEDDPLLMGHVMAHEIGHVLGLFHTTEAPSLSGKTTADTLPDTPAPAPDNLMHWTVTTDNAALSHEQRNVLRRSPWLSAGGTRP